MTKCSILLSLWGDVFKISKILLAIPVETNRNVWIFPFPLPVRGARYQSLRGLPSWPARLRNLYEAGMKRFAQKCTGRREKHVPKCILWNARSCGVERRHAHNPAVLY